MTISVALNLLGTPGIEVRTPTLRVAPEAAATVRDLLALIDRDNPGFATTVLEADGGLSPQFVVFINGMNIGSLGGLQAPLADGDAVNVIPAIAGG